MSLSIAGGSGVKPKDTFPAGAVSWGPGRRGEGWPLQESADRDGPGSSQGTPPTSRLQSLKVGGGGYLSDEDSANFLVIPTEGGEELMVSSGETVLITGAAWMDMGKAMRAPIH